MFTIGDTRRAMRLFCIVASAHPYFTNPIRNTMVAQAGQPSGWPVSDSAGISTSVWATTNHERGNSDGGVFPTIGDHRNGFDLYPNSA